MRILVTTILALSLAGCGGDPPPPAPRAAATEASADSEAAPTPGPSGVTRGGKRAVNELGDDPPAFASIGIKPKAPTRLDDLKATAKLAPGHSAYVEIDYTWFVNDREVLGWTRDYLPADRGAFKKGDLVHVRATASDEKKREAILESKDLQVLNSPPVILTDLRDARRMDGVRLEAEDVDDDKLTWKLMDGPPGVSVDRKGRIQVRAVQMSKEWRGEVVFAVTDPEGAGAELHIPVAINAAEAARVETTKETKRVQLEKMDQAKLGDAALQDADHVGNMNDAEFKKYMDDREARGGQK